jgi:RNA polymerase-binding transcription factor DksA
LCGGDETQDSGEQSVDLAREISQGLHEVDKRRLNDIERAIQKITEGTYGLSDLSGEPIPVARLKATPEAVLTVREEEQREKENHRGSPARCRPRILCDNRKTRFSMRKKNHMPPAPPEIATTPFRATTPSPSRTLH